MSEAINFEINICAKCNGKCCHEGLYVTKKEYDLMEDKYNYVAKGVLTREDVESILNNQYQL